jgi:hypothetical protein
MVGLRSIDTWWACVMPPPPSVGTLAIDPLHHRVDRRAHRPAPDRGHTGPLPRGLEVLAREYGAEEVVVVAITETWETRLRSYELLAGAFGLTPRGQERR